MLKQKIREGLEWQLRLDPNRPLQLNGTSHRLQDLLETLNVEIQEEARAEASTVANGAHDSAAPERSCTAIQSPTSA